MKKAIATALALLLTSCGYVLVDQKLVDRVTTLESQVQELNGMHNPMDNPTTTKPLVTVIDEESSITGKPPTTTKPSVLLER